ncbi:hypothetical protein ACHAWF_012713, partial [Thalassiosira exigua]
MASAQTYAYDDDSASASHLHPQPNQLETTPSGDGPVGSRFDPCQAYSGEACAEACRAVGSVNPVTTCGGVWRTTEGLSRFRPSNYFGRDRAEDAQAALEDSQHSPYLYSPSAPVGPTSCEYCGRRDTSDCPSNLPQDFNLDRSYNSGTSAGPGGGEGKHKKYYNADSNDDGEMCPRPKLFFLKKRPPFATPDGWNPVTEYRSNLFEPPSSVEGMGRGWGEVRGHLGGGGGGGSGANGAGPSRHRDPNRSYAESGCGSSACGAAETEISFSSAKSGGG